MSAKAGFGKHYRSLARERAEAVDEGTLTERILERRLVVPVREKCSANASSDPPIVLSEHHLREMTRCLELPMGLDFSSPGTGRQMLYRLRERVQSRHGLYFTSEFAVGLRFTIDPLTGMRWREHEFESEAASVSAQLARMWRHATKALGDEATDAESVHALADSRAKSIRATTDGVSRWLFARMPQKEDLPSALESISHSKPSPRVRAILYSDGVHRVEQQRPPKRAPAETQRRYPHLGSHLHGAYLARWGGLYTKKRSLKSADLAKCAKILAEGGVEADDAHRLIAEVCQQSESAGPRSPLAVCRLVVQKWAEQKEGSE